MYMHTQTCMQTQNSLNRPQESLLTLHTDDAKSGVIEPAGFEKGISRAGW